VRFSFATDPITTGLRCNCSICRRKGVVMSSVYVRDVAVEGFEALAVYRFGDRTVNHYFCRTCGIAPFHEAVARPGAFRINLGCLDDLDPLGVQITLVDGRSF
jgi:hypothetical protein